MHVEWLRTALKNLDDEATYIAQDILRPPQNSSTPS
ncbi:hypothetical protein C4K37_1412 [Pseudomonas chlororaphis subsp. piscium]|uniref:Plasmid stabilization system family protein n=1 Tax=Pseudomonas chlororaphis TaxID=587753 RepID=A0AAX3G1Y4_9PSED|nr:hypothetical protein C4K37_1412 [Pseudomonas chlororaphis subsp. piscium]AZC42360.1 hypothetical protein C4K36_1418 [Pseudomonas chlororaphis subsp. piscium]VEF76738.1 plasmid stabilization system family protein [Pseudomonas chlororaphis]